MKPRIRLILYTVLGAALGVVIGVHVAGENYGLAILVVLLSGWLVLAKTSAAPPDAWLLAVVLVGYLVGNRGFAQIQPAEHVPLLPAEAVLLVAIPALAVRTALGRAFPFRRDFLNYAILAWMAVGAFRLPLDMNRYGVMALRDFATIYYASLFFIAQAFGASEATDRLLRRALTIAFLALIPAVICTIVAPDFLLQHLTLRGIPIIYHKSDLIATSLAAGFFWLWTRWDRSRHYRWLVAASASLLLIGVMASPRAGMVAVGVTTVLWLLMGRWRMLAFQVCLVAVASVVSLVATSFARRDIRTSIPYSMYEHAASLFDPAGTGTYVNTESGDLGGNNQFRLIWWRDVIEDTLAQNPTLGLGFGADLSTRFLADYDLLSDETFAARSPHSMIVTIFGRMGILGLAAWIAVSAGVGLLVWRLLRSGDADGVGFASVIVVVWLSACVGVVLEGPMGAVVFWTVLGLASARRRSLLGAESPASAGIQAGGEWPVAKTEALSTQSGPR
jgi:hypothetical protein